MNESETTRQAHEAATAVIRTDPAETGSARAGLAQTGRAAAGSAETGLADHTLAETRDTWMRQALHDLCQPLTALDCLLYVNREPVSGESLDAGLLRNVIEEGLAECARMFTVVRRMQAHMLRLSEAEEDLV